MPAAGKDFLGGAAVCQKIGQNLTRAIVNHTFRKIKNCSSRTAECGIDYVRFWNQQLTDAQMEQVFVSSGEIIVITRNPANTLAAIGSTATFSVSATLSGGKAGTVLAYQWQTNGVNIPGSHERQLYDTHFKH